MKWDERALGLLVDDDDGIIQTGPFGSQLHEHEYQDEGIPVIMPKDIRDGRILTDSVARVSEQTAGRLARHRLKSRTIVLPRRGEITKRAFITPGEEGWLCGTGCLKIEVHGKHLVPEFLYYYLEQSHVVQWLEQHAVGTTMLNLNTQIVADLPIRYPGVDVQRAIAGTLSSYDDLIENNRRRMVLLEESARLLYREWFVYLRFPDHEHIRRVDGVPEGWQRMPLDRLCEVRRGASPRPISQFTGGDVPWFKIGDATASQSCFIFETAENVVDEGAKRSVSVEPGDLILSNSATCGIPSFAGVRGCIHDGWLYFSDYTRIDCNFLYCCLFARREELVASVSDGSTQKNLNTTAVGRLQITIPNEDTLLRQFGEFSKPVFNEIRLLTVQNQKLRAARDLLLPRLMSGELAV